MDSQIVIIETMEYCRICRSSEATFDISTDKLDGEDVLLHEALEFVSCLKIDFNDGMSQQMCAKCCKRLLESFQFKNQALEAYRVFCQQLSNTRNQKEECPVLEIGDSTVVIEECSFDDISKDPEKSETELDVDLSTDAVSFLLKHQNNKIEENVETDNILLEPKEEIEFDIVIEEEQFLEYSNSSVQEYQLRDTGNTESETDTETESHQPKVEMETTQTKLKKRKHKCNICEKLFHQKSNLIDHLRMHSKEKNFVCEFCEKSFVQMANYRTHVRIHTKERPYHCPLCPKSYTQGSQLRAHLCSHTCEKNYICPVCDKAFTTSTDLGKHKRIHDKSLQFKCEICDKMFAQRGNLRNHQRNIHLKKYNSK